MRVWSHREWMRTCGPAALCRMDESFLSSIGTARGEARIIVGACLTIGAGAMAYGYVFGLWRAPLQGLYSAVKMPLLMLAIVLSSALINTLLAQVMGSRLTFRQTCLSMLLGMAITSAILGSLSPVMLLFVLQAAPSCSGIVDQTAASEAVASSMRVYGHLLAVHVAVIGFAGIIGNLRVYGLLKRIAGGRTMALRLMAAWIAVTGFVGCELSWLFSPFLCKPTCVPHILPKEYFQQNFYERVFQAFMEFCR